MDIENPSRAFCEIPHSADIAIEVFGDTLSELFIHASEGLFHVMDLDTSPKRASEKDTQMIESDAENLLVAFLSDLIYEVENGTCFRVSEIDVGKDGLRARLAGYPIIEQKREIKAVTYHNLSIKFDDNKWHTQIIFDV